MRVSRAANEGAIAAPRVRLVGITRRFGATLANDRVDLDLQPGTIHALVGENGAGKSTLMRILYGLVRPTAGQILIDEHPVALRSPAAARVHGIGMIHQHFMLVPPMTVLENIVLGYPGWRGLRAWPRAALAARVAALAKAYGIELDPQARVADLGVGERQRVEIARQLFHGARLLICDEPTAVLAPPEVEALLGVLTRFRAEGRTVVFITHKLAEVLAVADRVTVLRRGRVVGQVGRAEFDREQLIAWIMGPTLARPARSGALEVPIGGAGSAPRAVGGDGPVLIAEAVELRGAGARPLLDRVSLALQPGEIVGVAGVQGNGQRELAEVLAGRRGFDGGELRIGRRRIGAGQRLAVADWPGLIPEDRSTEGLLPGLTLWENLLLAQRGGHALTRHGLYRHGRVRAWARPLLERFRVEPADPELRPRALSGGNQQKLLCARELARQARVLIAAQPTRGIDLASTAFLHALLRALRAQGGSVVLISADLDEILALADRVGVLYRGRLGRVRPRAEVTVAGLGREMVGLAPSGAGEPR